MERVQEEGGTLGYLRLFGVKSKKKDSDQPLGARSTQKLVKIHNSQTCLLTLYVLLKELFVKK